jgi:hypothetical protein
MHVRDPVECLYLSLMHRWQEAAPPDHHMGLLDGEPAENCQITRLAYVLMKVAVGQVHQTFSTLEQLTVRRDGRSHISRNRDRMESPYSLWDGWFLEGCVSLDQKRVIIRQLRQLGLTPTFVQAVEDFVAGKHIDRYFPTREEQEEIIRQYERLSGRELH